MRCIAILLAALYLNGCNGRNGEVSSNIQSRLDSLFNQLEKDGLFSGEVLITKDNETLHHSYYGFRDLASGTDFMGDEVFEIASVTKPFTALAIAKLVSESRIEYSDYADQYIPELPYDSITIKQLINHTSGLPDYGHVLYPNWDFNQVADNNDLLDILITKRPELFGKPGVEWKYSNIGYTLLAIIIERVTGQTYPEYLKNEIFDPLGMNSTRIPDHDESQRLANYTNDYVYSLGLSTYVDPKIWPSFDNATFTGDMYGAQGMCANAKDLLSFSSIFDSQSLVSDSIFDLYIKPQGIATPMSDDFTLGWFNSNDSILGSTYFYVGGFAGYRALFQYYPEKGNTIVLLSNASTTPIWELKEAVSNIISNKEVKYPSKSFVRYLGQQIVDNKNDLVALERTFSCDTSQYVLRQYELAELLDDYELSNDEDLVKVALRIVLKYFPENEFIMNRD